MTAEHEQTGGAPIERSSRRWILIAVGGILLLLVAGAALGVLRLPGSGGSARPPCDQLPTAAAVERALSTHSALIERIEKVGAGVVVSASRPCGGGDQALVRITVASEAERAGVDAILVVDGFGTPVELVRG